MIYPKEAEIVNIIRGAVAYSNIHNLAVIRNKINEILTANSHPYSCTTSIFLQLNDAGQVEFNYYIASTDPQYDDISGIMSI